MIGEILARDLGVDQRLHLAQPGERAVIEVAAEHERRKRVEQARAAGAITGDRARLDPGIAFPVAPLALEVLLHRDERQRGPARAAERPQAQVDAMDVAVGIALGDQADQRLADARVVGAGIDRARAIAAAAFGIGEHEVDIGRKIELAAAELAECEHDQPLQRTLRVAHHAVALGDFALGAPRSAASRQASASTEAPASVVSTSSAPLTSRQIRRSASRRRKRRSAMRNSSPCAVISMPARASAWRGSLISCSSSGPSRAGSRKKLW